MCSILYMTSQSLSPQAGCLQFYLRTGQRGDEWRCICDWVSKHHADSTLEVDWELYHKQIEIWVNICNIIVCGIIAKSKYIEVCARRANCNKLTSIRISISDLIEFFYFGGEREEMGNKAKHHETSQKHMRVITSHCHSYDRFFEGGSILKLFCCTHQHINHLVCVRLRIAFSAKGRQNKSHFCCLMG
jgi:hypothetical protein